MPKLPNASAMLAALAILISLAVSMRKTSADDAPSPADRKPIVLTDRARELHAHSLLIDGHNDMPWEIRKQAGSSFDKMDISKPQPTLQTDIPKLRKGGVGAQFWSVWVPVEAGYRGEALSMTLEQIDLVKRMIERYPDTFELALTADDIERIHAKGKIASMIGVEGGHCIEESLAALEKLYNLGARYMTLTHTDSLSWADSGTDSAKNNGLAPFGKQVVQRMNQLGMMVDLAHVSAKTMRDAIEASEAPVIFSHSSAFEVCKHPRNVPDDVLKSLKKKDGVVMVNFFSGFVVPSAAKISMEEMDLERELKKKFNGDKTLYEPELKRWKAAHKYPRGSIHDLLDHIDHIAKVAGTEYIGIGSDFDGVSLLPTQLDDASCYPYITQGLIDRGYTDQQIKGILGGNLLRVMRGVEAYAAKHCNDEPPKVETAK
ncbi:MAG TPA: dipeptidase [Lacipirellulaceae bacterium]|nr:dipeptidase [Lacipirellulaceae bacterium]